MLQPLPRGSALSGRRYRDWEEKFNGYRSEISQGRIQRWLEQFDEEDRDVAARLLDSVEFFGIPKITAAFRDILEALPGWHVNEQQRVGTWRFVPFSGSIGESGDSMTHFFRIANRLSGEKYRDLFVHRSQLVSEGLSSEDTVVLIDDFSGTGTQASDAWEQQFSELLYESPNIYLVLVAADYRGIKKISEATPMVPFPFRTLGVRDNLVGTSFFNEVEKTAIRRHCEKANRQIPLGFGDLGVVLVFQHRCPNNALAALHCRQQNWEPLFPRV